MVTYLIVTKNQVKSNLRKKKVVLALSLQQQSLMVGQSRQQDLEDPAGHIPSAASKQRQTNVLRRISLLKQIRIAVYGTLPPMFRVGFLSSVDLT